MDNLVAILASMLRSALAWEQEHGVKQYSAKIEPIKPLTNIPRVAKVERNEMMAKGDGDEHQDDIGKHQPC